MGSSNIPDRPYLHHKDSEIAQYLAAAELLLDTHEDRVDLEDIALKRNLLIEEIIYRYQHAV